MWRATWYSSEMPLAPSISRATRALSPDALRGDGDPLEIVAAAEGGHLRPVLAGERAVPARPRLGVVEEGVRTVLPITGTEALQVWVARGVQPQGERQAGLAAFALVRNHPAESVVVDDRDGREVEGHPPAVRPLRTSRNGASPRRRRRPLRRQRYQQELLPFFVLEKKRWIFVCFDFVFWNWRRYE